MTDIVKILGTTVPARTACLAQLSAVAVVVGHFVPHNVRHCLRNIVMEWWLQWKSLPAPVVKLIVRQKFGQNYGCQFGRVDLLVRAAK